MRGIFLALGSNLNNPKKQLALAVEALHSHADITVLAESSCCISAPLDGSDQPEYMNQVLEIDTELNPQQLLKLTQSIEQKLGRDNNKPRWSARIIDIDIVLFGNRVVSDADLQIPHPGLAQRNFVLYPLAEIAPDLRLPNQQTLQDLLRNCSQDGLTWRPEKGDKE